MQNLLKASTMLRDWGLETTVWNTGVQLITFGIMPLCSDVFEKATQVTQKHLKVIVKQLQQDQGPPVFGLFQTRKKYSQIIDCCTVVKASPHHMPPIRGGGSGWLVVPVPVPVRPGQVVPRWEILK